MTTKWDMVQAGKDAVALGVKYIFGAKPEGKRFRIYSRAEIDQMRNWYGSDCVWWSDSEKGGSLCCDCSGLMSKATGVIKGSWQLMNDAVAVYTIDQLWADWDRHIGMVLYMPGHVGIVSDTYGYYYAMDGSARNAVHNPMSANGWQKVLQISGVDYSSPKPTPKPEPKPEPQRAYSTKLYGTNNTPMQQYKFVKHGDHYEIVSVGRPGYALDVYDGSSKDHSPVRVYLRNGTKAQLFDFKKIKTKHGFICYEIIPVCAPGMRVDCVSGGTTNKTGLQIHPPNDTDAQRFLFAEDSNGNIRIISVKSGLAIDCGSGVQS